MSKKTKIWLIIATLLIVIGTLIFGLIMTINNWDFTKLATTVTYKTNRQIDDEFNNISIETDTEDIVFALSQNGKCEVVCYEEENLYYSAEVVDGTLTIKQIDERNWYEYIGITMGESDIIVYLPETEYKNLLIEVSTGDINIPKDFKFENIDISVSTGDIKNSALADTIKIKTDTGDVKLDKCDAKEIFVKTDTGDVTGSFLTPKVFITKTDTGDIDVPKSISGGRCEIETDTGDIKFN